MRDSINKFLAKETRDALEEAEENARKEDKDWFFVFKEKGKQRDYVITDWDFFLKLLKGDEKNET